MPERSARQNPIGKLLRLLVGAAVACHVAGAARAQTRHEVPRAGGGNTTLLDYPPRERQDCPPTVIFSHGFGGDETQLAGLARALAANGWRVLAMRHAESGRPALRAVLFSGLPAIDDAARAAPLHTARFADLDAAYGEATRRCRPFPLILAGHSMGAQTTMMEAGAVARIGPAGGNRFDAYIALSPQGVGSAFAPGAWRAVNKPVLMITGTRDRVANGDFRERLSAFEGMPPGNKRLAILPGAGHLQIGGIGSRSVAETVTALVLEFTGEVKARHVARSRIAGVETREK
ncbi:MAG: hypothetical protein K2P80_15445 [Beijerinckiaceae bacterium]|nr:hypothetical protein [Beijerinckiaceae bacterium]